MKIEILLSITEDRILLRLAAQIKNKKDMKQKNIFTMLYVFFCLSIIFEIRNNKCDVEALTNIG